MLTAEHIHEIRAVVRLEALRAAVLSHASESLDDQIPQLVVTVSLAGDTMDATIEYRDPTGHVVSGASL